ncbi:MAG: hypothetical protein M3367_12710 [Acidobacteriota bacterium]|nr:hypothetical protein [Acidobacteriota bacterium]
MNYLAENKGLFRREKFNVLFQANVITNRDYLKLLIAFANYRLEQHRPSDGNFAQ